MDSNGKGVIIVDTKEALEARLAELRRKEAEVVRLAKQGIPGPDFDL